MIDNLEMKKEERRRVFSPLLFLFLLSGIGISVAVWSITVGSASISVPTVWEALVRFDQESVAHYTIRSVRLPRIVVAILVGASMAVSGAIMQGLTRNPLASPSIMGVSAGSSLAIVLAFAFIPFLNYQQMIIISMGGAACGALLVYSIGVLSSQRLSGSNQHVRLALAGAAVSALCGAFADGIQIYHGLSQTVMQWYAAGISGVKWIDVQMVWPWTIAGLLIAFFLSRQLSLLAMGEEVATGLGQRVVITKWLGAIAVFALTGSAVAVAGSISFVGLMVPHIVRFIVGVHYKWIIPCSAVMGGGLLLLADTLSRLVNMPRETPVGIITAMLGVPFFIYLARRDGRGGL